MIGKSEVFYPVTDRVCLSLRHSSVPQGRRTGSCKWEGNVELDLLLSNILNSRINGSSFFTPCDSNLKYKKIFTKS